MRWYIPVVAVLVLLIGVAAYFFNRGVPEAVQLQTVDSSLAKQGLFADSTLTGTVQLDSVKAGAGNLDSIPKNPVTLPQGAIDTKGAQPAEVVRFAKTFIGVPYLYGSTDPAKGFDCSGFITHVFKRFDIVVPRSSIDFTHVGTEVSAAQARAGDLILFTGTDSLDKFVGHMGIVVDNSDSLRFIHSTSGKQYGVTITPLNKYYQRRYVKTVRIFQ